jgi:hypothetical protein
MSDNIQETNTVTIDASTMETPVKKTRGRKAASEATGGAGDKPVSKEKVKKEKVKKVKKEKPKKEKAPLHVSKTWNVPTRHDRHWEQTRFLKSLHSLIKELTPHLLEMEDIRDEYNKLVEFLSKFDNTHFRTWNTSPSTKYSLYANMGHIYNEKYTFLGSQGRWQDWRTENSHERKLVEGEWLKFWNLIKPVIWEPLAKIYFEKNYRVLIKKYQETVIALENDLERRIRVLRDNTEHRKKWYIEQITNMLKHDPSSNTDAGAHV